MAATKPRMRVKYEEEISSALKEKFAFSKVTSVITKQISWNDWEILHLGDLCLRA